MAGFGEWGQTSVASFRQRIQHVLHQVMSRLLMDIVSDSQKFVLGGVASDDFRVEVLLGVDDERRRVVVVVVRVDVKVRDVVA